MTTIIAGRFIEQDDAAAAMARLVQAGFEPGAMTSFFVNAPGQHDKYPIGGDEDESPGTESAGPGAIGTAVGGGGVGAVVGLATMPILGPASALAGAAIGAYVGSFVGALGNMDPTEKIGGTSDSATAAPAPPEPRKSGMLVAVEATALSRQASAIDVLRSAGAADIERAEGNIRAGAWPDFDPLATVVWVDRSVSNGVQDAPVR
ncbi:MAG: hypothetical protein ABI607_00615 [Betaproteobacteria bacterium]